MQSHSHRHMIDVQYSLSMFTYVYLTKCNDRSCEAWVMYVVPFSVFWFSTKHFVYGFTSSQKLWYGDRKKVYFEFQLDTHLCGLQNPKIEFQKMSVCMYCAGSSSQTTEPLQTKFTLNNGSYIEIIFFQILKPTYILAKTHLKTVINCLQ